MKIRCIFGEFVRHACQAVEPGTAASDASIEFCSNVSLESSILAVSRFGPSLVFRPHFVHRPAVPNRMRFDQTLSLDTLYTVLVENFLEVFDLFLLGAKGYTTLHGLRLTLGIPKGAKL